MKMKMAVKNMLARLANSDFMWPLFRWLRQMSRQTGAFCDYVERQRRAGARRDLKSAILRERFPDLRVRHGAFAGMTYSSAAASGSALLPKLLGSYESEVSEFLERARNRDYDVVVDVGCAEGYYAVGLARLFERATVYAFDVDEGARRLCRQMAEINGVADRVEIRGFCDPAALRALDLGARALVVLDCEGYEATLLTTETAGVLANHDVILECHDFKDPGLSRRIRAAFAATHDVEEAAMVPDFVKAQEFEAPEFEGYNFEVRKFMVTEARGAPQVWLFLSSKLRAGITEAPAGTIPEAGPKAGPEAVPA